MKYHSFLRLTLVIGLTLPVCAQSPSAHPDNIVKRPSHSDLAKKQKQQLIEKHKKRGHSDPVKPIVTVKKRSLIKNSTLITDGRSWTLVPKGSVIFTPERHKYKITTQPRGRLVDWKTFLRKNHGWLQVHAVAMTQAQGKKKLDAKAIEAYQKMGKIVVATCAGGPISVAPDALKIEEEKK